MVVPQFGVTGFSFLDSDRSLSTRFDSISDTNFYLGQQNSDSLLDDLLAQS